MGALGAAAPAFAAPAPFLVDGPYSAKAPSGYSWSENQTGTLGLTAPAPTSFVVDGPFSLKPANIAGDGIGA